MTTKESVRRLIDALPEDTTLEDVQYHLYVLQKIRAGEQDIEAGRTIPHEQVMRELASWVK